MTNVELFFDLVFVFAITQISHALLAHFTPSGVLQAAIMMGAVWWLWVFTAWTTNWLDPERTPVRLMLFVLMVGGLLLSTSIPKAFESRGLVFAGAYAAMQVGRTAFFLWCVPQGETGHRNNFTRILVWLGVSAVLWVAGGFADGAARLTLWLIALAIEYVGPLARFRIPVLGASSFKEWEVEGGHMAERCALFIIIALGESIVVTGATFAETAWTVTTTCAFVVALVGSIAMWWIYFHIGAEAGAEYIATSENSGQLARLAYTYLHLPIVAGIVVSAVGDEFLLAHPDGHVEAKEVIGIVGGPLIYLVGAILFKRSVRGFLQLSHLVGIAALAVLAGIGVLLTPLVLASAVAAVLVTVAIWEARSLGARRRQSTATSA